MSSSSSATRATGASGAFGGFEYDDATLIESPTWVALKTTGLAVVYAGAAVVADLNPYDVLPAWLAELLVVGAVVIGVFHAVFVPSWTNRSVLAWAERQEIERARHLTPVQQAEQDDAVVIAATLVRRTVGYRAWVRIRSAGSIGLTKRGERLRQAAVAARPPS